MTIDEEIERAIPLGDDGINNLSSAALREIGRRWLAEQHQKAQRSAVHQIERKALRRQERSEALRAAIQDAVMAESIRITPEYRELFGESFEVEKGGETVLWEEATIDQHRRRAEMLERMAEGTAQTAARHRRVIADLKAWGVGSLLEAEDAAA